MTVCCQCGRKYWPGKGMCPGRPLTWEDGGRKVLQPDSCNHEPCKNCTHYVDEKEKSYVKKEHDAKRSSTATPGSERKQTERTPDA